MTRKLPFYIRRHNTVILPTRQTVHLGGVHSFTFHAIKENGKSKISPKKWKNIKYFMVCAWLTSWQAWASYDAPSDCSNAFAHLIKDRMIQSHEVWNPCDGEAYQKSLQWMTQRANETPVMGRHDPKSEWHLYWLQLKLSTEVLDRFEEHLTHQFIW